MSEGTWIWDSSSVLLSIYLVYQSSLLYTHFSPGPFTNHTICTFTEPPLSIDMMTDSNVHVKDTTMWTLGRICELFIGIIQPDVHLFSFITALVNGLSVIQKCLLCLVILHLPSVIVLPFVITWNRMCFPSSELVSISCWNSKHHQPDTSTSLHLCIDGFSCHHQLMPLAGMFVPVTSFPWPHDIILWLSIDFSTIIPLRFLGYVTPYFPVPFISCYVHFLFLRCCTTLECDIWGELLYIQWYSVLHHIDYVHVAIYLQIPPCSFCVSLT